MRTVFPTFTLLLVLAVSSFAEEPDTITTGGNSETNERLHQRIKQLEERIERLEERIDAIGPEVPPQYVSPPIYRQPKPPTGVPRNHYPSPGEPRRPDRASPVPPHDNVPENWQRFEFNGQFFYIIPVDQFNSAQQHWRQSHEKPRRD